MTYLDVNLIISEGKLETDRHIKPTNPKLFLHYNSNHSPLTFKAIIYGQVITVKTICSKKEYVSKHFENLKQKFIERGYPLELVDENLMRGAALDREDLLRPKLYPSQATPAVGVVIMYSTQNFNMCGAGYDYTTYSKNFLLARFISIYYTAIAHSA